MSGLSPLGSEIIYQMQAVGATKTTTTQSLVSGNASGNPAFQMPALASIWSPDRLQGKTIMIKAGGTYDAGAVTNTLVIAADSTQGTIGTTLASTGAATIISSTTGNWYLEVTLNCISVGNNTSGWATSGYVMYGTGNNAGTAGAALAMVGGAQSAGVPTALNLATSTTIGYIELWSTFGTAPTAFVCSQFSIWGCN